MICSDTDDLETEIKHLERVFCEINEYPTKIVKKIIVEEKERYQEKTQEPSTTPGSNDETTTEDEKTIYINLPFAGPQQSKENPPI